MEMERGFCELKGRVKERQNIVKLVERQSEKCHYMTSVELAKVMGKARLSEEEHKRKIENNYRTGRSIRKPYNAVSTLYNGEGRGCRMGIKDDLKKVGAVTDLAESKI